MNFKRLLPIVLQSILIRQLVKIEGNHEDYQFKIASSREEFEQAFKLLHDCYVNLGIMDPHPSGLRCNVYSALPHASVVIALHNDIVIGTVTLIQDSSFGIPSDNDFIVENNRLREKHGKLAEASAMAIHKDYRKSKRSNQLSLHMMNYMQKIFSDYSDCNTLIAVTHPRVYPFYKGLFNFKKSGKPKKYKFANKAMGIHLSATKDSMHDFAFNKLNRRKPHRNLYSFFFEQQFSFFKLPKEVNSSICPKMSESTLKYFFEEKTKLFYELSIRDLLVIKKAYDFFHDLSCLESVRFLLEFTSGRQQPVLVRHSDRRLFYKEQDRY